MQDLVRCNWCEKTYEDLDIVECKDCKTDAYLMDVKGE